MRYKIDRNHKITRFLCLLLGMILLTGSMCIPVYAAEYWPEGRIPECDRDGGFYRDSPL